MLLRALLGIVALVVLALGGAGAWLLGTQEGLAWIAARAQGAVPELRIEEPRGTLLGEIALRRAAWKDQVEATDVAGHVSLLNALTGALRVDSLRAASVRVTPRDDGDPPPSDLALPLRIVLSDVVLGELRVERDGEAPLVFTKLRFNYTAGPGGHNLHNATAVTPWGEAKLDATMETEAPFEIDAKGELARAEARVRAHAVVHPLAEVKLHRLEAGVPDLDLARIDRRLPRTGVDVRIRGAGAPGALLAGTATATNKDPAPLDRRGLPVRSLDARFVLREGGALDVAQFQAMAGGGSVSGSARVRGAERVEVDAVIQGIDLAAVRSTLRRTAIGGSLKVAWTPERLDARGLLEEKGMRVAGEASQVGQAIKATLGFTGVDPARVGDYPAGTLNGSALVSGRLAGPRDLSLRWSIDQSVLRGERFATRGRARLGEDRVRDVQAVASWAKNRLDARGGFGREGEHLAWTLVAPEPPLDGFSGAVRAKGTASGTLAAPRLELEASAAPAVLGGRVRVGSLTARGNGTIDDHRVELGATGSDYALSAKLEGGWRDGWQGRITALRNEGSYPLELLEPVTLEASAARVTLGRLRAALGEGRVAIERLAWTPGRIETAGEFSGFPAAWLVGAAGLGEQMRATLLLDGAWAITSSPRLDGALRVSRASGDLFLQRPAALELGLASLALHADFAADRVDARLTADAKLGALSARARTSGIEKASTLEAQAEVRLADLRVIAGPLPPELRVGGRAALKASARGTVGEPEVAARLEGEALTVHVPPYGVYLDDGVLAATLAGDTLRVDELRMRGGEGRLVASGTLPLTADGEAALRWRAQQLQLLGRPDMRLVVSGEGNAGLRARRVALDGRLQVERGYFERSLDPLPELGDDVVIVGQDGAKKAGPGSSVPLDLALRVDLGQNLKLREAGFDGGLRGALDLSTAKDGSLQAKGRISAFDATYRAYGRTLTVDPGELVFDGPVRNPGLQIEAWRKNQEVPAGVRVTGTLEQPRVELVSDPPLPEGAKLSWLVLGRAPTDATGADLAVLQTAASAMLGRGDSVPITTRIADAVGLDELAVRGSSQIESRVVAVGKRLSDRLYLTYEAGVGAAAQNLVKIDLSVTQRISLRAQTGTTSGAGVYYRYSWD